MLRRIVLDGKCINLPLIYAEKMNHIHIRKALLLCSRFHSQVPVRAKRKSYKYLRGSEPQEIENPLGLEPTTATAESIFRSMHEEDKELTAAEWDRVTEKILGTHDIYGKIVKPINISSVIFKTCETNNTINIAKSWADYSGILESPDQIKLGPAVRMAAAVDIKDQEELVLRIANYYLSQGIKNIVLASLYWSSLKLLAKTSKWENGIEIMNQYWNTNKETSLENPESSENLHPHVIVPFGIRALQLGNIDLLFELMEKPEFHEFQIPLRLRSMTSSIYIPQQEALFRYIINYSYTTKFRSEGTSLRNRLYEYFSKYQFHISEDLAAHISDHHFHFEADQKRSEIKTLTKINYKTGQCLTCANKLTRTTITDAEFESLKTGILETVLVGDDIYKNTDPKELKEFLKRVSKEQYDIVIDGLNVSYFRVPGQRTSLKPVGISSANLMETVAHFYKQGKRIMVMHRPEIKGFPHFPEIDTMASVHILGNVSQDDPYFLLASLYSKCLFLTNDILRQHIFLLTRKDRQLAQLFNRWQVSHQVFILGFELVKKAYTGSPDLMFPPAHDVNPTKTGDYWHIPLIKVFDESSKYVSIHKKSLYYGNHNEWICLGPKVKSPSKLKLPYHNVDWPEWAQSPTPTDNQPDDQFYGSFRDKLTHIGSSKEGQRKDGSFRDKLTNMVSRKKEKRKVGSFRDKLTNLDSRKEENRKDNKKYLKYISVKEK